MTLQQTRIIAQIKRDMQRTGMSGYALAHAIEYDTSAVYHFLNARQWSEPLMQTILTYFGRPLPVKRIGRAYRMPLGGIAHRPSPKATRNANIVRRIESGESQSRIARQLGVSRQCINQIYRRESAR